jgi:hypothetical protein
LVTHAVLILGALGAWVVSDVGRQEPDEIDVLRLVAAAYLFLAVFRGPAQRLQSCLGFGDEAVDKTRDLFHCFDMPGRWYAELFEIAAGQNGFVTTEDVRELGGTTQVLADMHRHHHLERRGHGLYRFTAFPSGPFDELMQATLWPRGLGVISHDSALDLWDLCDVNPAKIHVTVPRAARIRRVAPVEYVIHPRDLAPTERTHVEGIPVVTPGRAIADGIERHLDRRLIEQALDAARRRGLVPADELACLAVAR